MSMTFIILMNSELKLEDKYRWVRTHDLDNIAWLLFYQDSYLGTLIIKTML